MMVFSPKNILVPVDFSEFSRQALSMALDIAKAHSSSLTLLHVMEDPMKTIAYAGGGMGVAGPGIARWEEIRTDVQEGAEREMRELVSKFVPRENLKTQFQWGVPADEILKAAEGLGCDLLVMSTHGRTGLSRLFMGSVAEAIVRQAPCPTLILRSKE